MEREPHRPAIYWQIAVAVMVWAVAIATGSLRPDRYDPRRSLILVACALGFTLFWFAVLRWRNSRGSDGGALVVSNSISWTSVSSAALMSVAFVLFVSIKLFTPANNSIAMDAQSWLILGLTLAAQVLAVVGLSEPRPRRGKMAGIVSMLLLAIMLVMMIAEVVLG